MTSGWDILSSLANVVTASAAAAVAWPAWKSLTSWRTEAVGRRRIELAEDVLADFYEARDVLRWVRSPIGYANEHEERPGRDDEPDEPMRAHRDTYYAPIKRLSDRAEFFGKLQARKYRVIATFDEQAAAPFEALQQIHGRIAVAARMLMRIMPREPFDQRDLDRQVRWEQVIWDNGEEDDPLTVEINALVGQVEARFRTEITKNIP